MTRSLSNARLFSAVSDLFTVLVPRRNFSTPSSNAFAIAAREDGRKVVKKVEESTKAATGEKTSWMPDPVTGYFTPEDQFGQIDVAQMRQILLNQRR